MARWRKEAVRSWRRQPFAKNSTDVADWFFGSFESKEYDLEQSPIPSRIGPADWRAAAARPYKVSSTSCNSRKREAAATCASWLGQVRLATHGRVPFCGLAVHDDRVWGTRDPSNTSGSNPGRRFMCIRYSTGSDVHHLGAGQLRAEVTCHTKSTGFTDRTERATRAATLGIVRSGVVSYLIAFAALLFTRERISRPGRAGVRLLAFVSVSTVGLGDYALEKPGIGASLIVVLGCASWAVTLGLVQDTIVKGAVLATLCNHRLHMRSRLFELMRRLRDDARRRRNGRERAPPDTPGVVMPLPRMMMTNPIHECGAAARRGPGVRGRGVC